MYQRRHALRGCALRDGSGIPRWATLDLRCFASRPSAPEDGGVLKSENDLNNWAQQAAPETTDLDLRESSGHGDRATDAYKSPVRRPLPLSPLMDPKYLAAKQKYRLRKAEPSKEPTPFQRQLAKNPYARALDTPVRMCHVTRTVLPSFFLQDFELIAHPSANELWYLPRSLTSPHSVSSAIAGASPPAKRGRKSYTLSRASLIRSIKSHDSGSLIGEERFLSPHTKLWKAFRGIKRRWRPDMDMFILELMRRRVEEGLRYLCSRKKGYLIGCKDWEYAKGCKQIGAFLWLGPRDGEKGADAGASVSPGEFATLDMVSYMSPNLVLPANSGDREHRERPCWHCNSKEHSRSSCQEWLAMLKGTTWNAEKPGKHIHERATGDKKAITLTEDRWVKNKVPVHSLRLLLGKDRVETLSRELPFIFNYEVVALRNRRNTIDVQLRLWKLQGYLAEYKQVNV